MQGSDTLSRKRVALSVLALFAGFVFLSILFNAPPVQALTDTGFRQNHLQLIPKHAAAHLQTLAVEALVKPDGTLNTMTDASGTVNLEGWDVTLDPKRGPLLSRANAAPSAVDTWSALSNKGLDNGTVAIAVLGADIFVGGGIAKTYDGLVPNLNNIARYDGTSWHALSNNGLNGVVRSLVVMESDLYVGGEFTQTYDGLVPNLNHIARYDGTSWQALPNKGLNGTVFALAVSGSDLYVGGSFSQTNDTNVSNLNRIAKYDGTNWIGLNNQGLNDTVFAIAALGSNLYVGGSFSQTNDANVTNLNRIARYDGANWHALNNHGVNDSVYALAALGSNLYVGGAFTQSHDGSVTALNSIARYDGNNWYALSNQGLSGAVNSIAVFGNELYVGGNFAGTVNPGFSAQRIIRYSGTTWTPLANSGLNYNVLAIAINKSNLYAVGVFSKSADLSVTNLNYIAKLTLAPTQTGPTFVVNTNADTDDGLCDTLGAGHGNKDCTLREAINAANAKSGTDTIHFAGNYNITLTSGLPHLSDNVTIDGETHTVSLDGVNTYRILTVDVFVTLDLNHLTLRNGAGNPDLSYGFSGGAIYNNGGVLNVKNSTFENNNVADYGGAIFGDGDTNISNSTFHTNTAGAIGGAVLGTGSLVVKNSTLSYGESPAGAGLYSQGFLTLVNTIIANSAGPDCTNTGSITSEKNNLIENTGADACDLVNGTNGDKVGVDPKLGSLANNGGVTQTFALLSGSPAIDAGDNVSCAAAPVNNLDQRGVTRPQDGDNNSTAVCDIGAYEVPKPNTPTPTITRTRTPTNTPTRTNTPTNTITRTNTPTNTITRTSTPTNTITRTNTPTNTITRTSTPTRTNTPTLTPTSTPTTGCLAKPGKPTLSKPKDNVTVSGPKVKLDWSDVVCTQSYKVLVKNTATGQTAFKTTITNPLVSNTKTGVLPAGTYKWFVKACNTFGCAKSIKFLFSK